MARVALSITTLTDDSEQGVALIQSLLDKGWLEAEDIGLQRHWAQRISLDGVRLLLSRMLDDQSPEATYTSVSFVSARLEKHPDEAESLAQSVVPLLRRSAGDWTARGMFSRQWRLLADLYVDSHPVEIADAAFTVFRLSDLPFYFYDLDSIWELVRKALQRKPEAVWNRLMERTHLSEDSPEHISKYSLRELRVSSTTTADILLRWASDHQPRGPELLANMAFTGGKFLSYLVRELIIQYSDNDDVMDILKGEYLNVGVHSPDEYVDLLRSLRDTALEWLQDESHDVRRWVQDVMDELDELLAGA